MSDKKFSELARGAWDSGTTYTVGDIVDNNGSSFACIVNNTNQEPPNTSFWALLAEKGEQGEQGEAGEIGINWRNAWNDSTAYEERDAVSYLGSSYFATEANTNKTPGADPEWSLIAQKGSDGAGSGDFKADGSVPMTGNLNFDGNKGVGLSDPTNDQDAATKKYVDDRQDGEWELLDEEEITSSVSSVVFNDINHNEVMVVCDRVTSSVSGRRILSVSSDNGSTWLSNVFVTNTSLEGTTTISGGSASTVSRSSSVLITGFNNELPVKGIYIKTSDEIAGSPDAAFILTGNILNAVRVTNTSGNLNGGKIYLLGR